MNKRERLLATIEGRAVDRVPVALWRHWPVDDQEPTALAWSTLRFQQLFDWDLVKVTPASSFCLRDWGAMDHWQGHYHGTREYGAPVIVNPDDWARLRRLDPTRGALGAQLEALRRIRAGLPADVPVIQTVFNPLAQAKNLAGGARLLAHLRQAPEAVQPGLRVIAETTEAFVAAAMAEGIDGVFFAVQHAQAHLLSADEYVRFGRTYDLPILDRARNGWLNVLHLHGEQIYFDLLADYPVQVVNWHDQETEPALADGLRRFAGAVCGGIRQEETLVLGDAAAVRAAVRAALEATGGRRLIVGTGCVTPTTAPLGNLLAARTAVESA
jgi:uroporphyrinogen decarboxylase